MKRLLLAVLAAVATFVPPALAGTLADLHVLSRSTGQRLPVYAHGGKLYIAGQPGERYSVQVVNRSGRRILAVVSVDGINVVSGETAAPDQTGYVFAPWQSYDIMGWRKNADEVAAFYFTALPDSYAARTGRPANVGVIGVAVFREWSPPRPRPHSQPRGTPEGAASEDRAEAHRAEAPAAADAAANEMRAQESVPGSARMPEKLGTGHGERTRSAVTFTDFRRASEQPNEVITLYYDRYENLLARGIIPATAPHHAHPVPFPRAVGFVPDPR
ncbi:MAG: hypothetical protein IT531_13085 [Burkholderiales bacterium]|nr:hypothetical protein [Burkholderiales bacterium]